MVDSTDDEAAVVVTVLLIRMRTKKRRRPKSVWVLVLFLFENIVGKLPDVGMSRQRPGASVDYAQVISRTGIPELSQRSLHTPVT